MLDFEFLKEGLNSYNSILISFTQYFLEYDALIGIYPRFTE